MQVPDPQQNARLIDEARQGDADAGARLLDFHRATLRRIIDNRLDPGISRREDASDIVQNVMIEAHRRLGQYLVNPTMPFQLWLRHIAQDHIIDAHRRHRQAQRRSLDREQYLNPAALSDQSSIDLAGQLFDKQPTPASEAIRQELRENLLKSIGDMNSDDREIILMRHVDQLSNHEVATALEVTEAAASMRYLRAIRRLKEQLSSPENRNPNDDPPGS
jgi:RNA polymerase sigma-70 factor (ECF subfamily)